MGPAGLPSFALLCDVGSTGTDSSSTNAANTSAVPSSAGIGEPPCPPESPDSRGEARARRLPDFDPAPGRRGDCRSSPTVFRLGVADRKSDSATGVNAVSLSTPCSWWWMGVSSGLAAPGGGVGVMPTPLPGLSRGAGRGDDSGGGPPLACCAASTGDSAGSWCGASGWLRLGAYGRVTAREDETGRLGECIPLGMEDLDPHAIKPAVVVMPSDRNPPPLPLPPLPLPRPS